MCLNDYEPSNIYDSEELKDKKEDVILKFKELKSSNQLDLFSIKNLLDHCNIVPEIIECYLNKLKEVQSHEYINELINYYKVLSPDICIRNGISKKSEKELFYEIIDNYINMDNKDFDEFAKLQFSKVPEEVDSIYKNEIQNIKDKKQLEEKASQFLRWDTIYNSSIDLTNIYNEEYFYYKMSNCLLREYFEGLISIKSKKETIKILFELFKKIEPKKKEYAKYFEFICLALLNGQINNNHEMKKIIDCIESELQNKFFNLEEIKNFLNEKKITFFIKNNNIEIQYNNYLYKIKNYQNYNINKEVIDGLLFTGKFTYKIYLNYFINFNAYTNGQIYYKGILNQVIKKYVRSNLAKESIEKLFSINKNNYKTLFEEVTTDKIMKYIYYLPYNSRLDTERALKIFSKIIIDPLKNLYIESVSNKFELQSIGAILNKFVNIVLRKFKFGHEHHHLASILLFYLYVNKSRHMKIHSFPKEIDVNSIEVLTEDCYKEKKINKNIFKKAEYYFEYFVYGKRQAKFSLKQILFIANEENEELDCNSFKEKYNECEAATLDYMLQSFPQNQVLSSLVNEIRENFEEEAQLQSNYGKTAENILGNEVISIVEAAAELISIEKFGRMDITVVDNCFNNTIYEREFIK